MQQDDWGPVTQKAIDNFRVAALDLPKIHARYGVGVTRCPAMGAVSSKGSSGITIQAMG
jgi:hypothetical protein